ncbi:MAG TPA: AAA family ATPase, partial [Burkholderiaceae bacterium]
ALEYAVKMREFPQDCLASRVLERGGLSGADVDAMAAELARFHSECDSSPPDDRLGGAANIHGWVSKSFAVVRPLLRDRADLQELARLEQWMEAQFQSRRSLIEARRKNGQVRECHGDLHLQNIVMQDGKPRLFDCIEFNEELRWIDVVNDAAFLAMDLHVRGRSDYAHRFLNAYFEATGDYAGLPLLRFYMAYRALVRAEVALLSRAGAARLPDESYARYREHIDFAAQCALPAPAWLILMHGLSGTGKTTISTALLAETGAIRIRSDVERKRGGTSAVSYSRQAIDANYERLLELAGFAIDGGFGVIVDAAFLRRTQRELFAQFARRRNIPYVFLSLQAEPDELARRLASRKQHGADASDADQAVLERQILGQDALGADETAHAVRLDAMREWPSLRGPVLEGLRRHLRTGAAS